MNDEHETEDESRWYHGPLKLILGLFLLLILLSWLVPYYSVALDPRPKDIPSYDEIMDSFDVVVNESFKSDNLADYVRDDVTLRKIATKISTESCDEGRICYAKALYYFVRDNIEYVNDPVGEDYYETGEEVLLTKGADCESGTLLLASFYESIGIDSEIVIIPGHAFLRVRLPEALSRYKKDGDYVYLDWTCSSCDFGEIPWQNVEKEKRIVYV